MNAIAPDARKVPMLPFALAVIIGVITALYSDLRSGTLLVACAGLFLLSGALLWKTGVRWFTLLAVLAAFASLGAFRASGDLGRSVRREVETLADRDSMVTAVGQVVSAEAARNDQGIVVTQQVRLWGDSGVLDLGPMRVRVFVDSSLLGACRYGDLLCARGRFSPFSEQGTGTIGGLITGISHCEVATIFADSANVVVEPRAGYRWRRAVDRLRASIIRTFDTRLGPDGAALCKALVLGERGDFSEDFSDKLRVTGLSHVFALSGMNVGFLVAMIWALFSVLFIPRTLRLVLLFAVVLLYMELGRETASLVRATLMAAVYIVGTILHRRPNPANSVACAAFLEVLWKPLDVVDAGFSLSYLAVLGLIGGYEFLRAGILKPFGRRPAGLVRGTADVLSASTAAQIGTLPMIGFLFGRIPILGALGNILAVPAFAILLLWAVLLLLAQAIVPVLAPLVASSLEGASFLMGKLVEGTASLPMASLAVEPYSPLVTALLYAAVLLLLVGFTVRRGVWIGAAMLLALNVLVWPAVFAKPDPDCAISFISVGNGDAALLSTADGKHVLVDAGPAFAHWSAASRILPFLREQGVRHLDALVLTHPDNDHIGGAADILRAIPVNHLFVNGDVSLSRTALELDLAKSRAGIHEEQLAAGTVLRLSGQVSLTVLSPDSALLASAAADNQKSLVLRVDCGKSSVLLMADVDSSVDNNLNSWQTELDVDLLKVAHHGSKSGTSAALLMNSTPGNAVISVGKRNIYGHPHPSVLGRLAAFGIPYHMTSREGTLTYVSSGEAWVLRESRSHRLARLWKLPHG